MRKVEQLHIEYVGYQTPETPDEVQMEILGLESAIKAAEFRIATLRQGLQLNKLMILALEESNDKTIKTSPDKTSVKQTS